MDITSQLKRDEGFSSRSYKDTTGHETIGYGFNLDIGIPSEVAEFWLDFKIQEARKALTNSLPIFANLDEVRQGVLLNMTYNLGIGGILGFPKAIQCMQNGDWEGAANELLDSLWAKQVGDRAERLAKQLRTGEWV